MTDEAIILRCDAVKNMLSAYIEKNEPAMIELKDRVSKIEEIQQSDAVHRSEFETEVKSMLSNILENQAIKDKNRTAIRVALIALAGTFITSLATILTIAFSK
jgi:hypothetical protein